MADKIDTERSKGGSLTQAETQLLCIYWYLYYDEDAPGVLNQSWPTVWRIFEQIHADAPLSISRAPMRKHLLDAGFTCKPEGVVGHEGLRRRSIVKLRREGFIVGKGAQRDLAQDTKQVIVDAAWIVAQDVIEKSIGSLSKKYGTIKGVNNLAAMKPPVEMALDREPKFLSDSQLDQARRSKVDFSGMLDRDTLIGYLKAAQSDLGLKTQMELANFLGVSDAMVRKAFAGKATLDTLSDYLHRCGIEVRTVAVKAGSDVEKTVALTKG